jgi:hypothetical protein
MRKTLHKFWAAQVSWQLIDHVATGEIAQRTARRKMRGRESLWLAKRITHGSFSASLFD